MSDYVALTDGQTVAPGDTLRITLDYYCWPFTCPTGDTIREVIGDFPLQVSAVDKIFFGTGSVIFGTPIQAMTTSELKAYLIQAIYAFSNERAVALRGIGIPLVERAEGSFAPSVTTTVSLAAIAVIVLVSGYLLYRFSK